MADNSQMPPSRWEIWRGLINRYELSEILPVGDWVSIVAILEAAFIQNPDDIASLSRLDGVGFAIPSSTGARSLAYGRLANVCAKPRRNN